MVPVATPTPVKKVTGTAEGSAFHLRPSVLSNIDNSHNNTVTLQSPDTMTLFCTGVSANAATNTAPSVAPTENNANNFQTDLAPVMNSVVNTEPATTPPSQSQIHHMKEIMTLTKRIQEHISCMPGIRLEPEETPPIGSQVQHNAAHVANQMAAVFNSLATNFPVGSTNNSNEQQTASVDNGGIQNSTTLMLPATLEIHPNTCSSSRHSADDVLNFPPPPEYQSVPSAVNDNSSSPFSNVCTPVMGSGRKIIILSPNIVSLNGDVDEDATLVKNEVLPPDADQLFSDLVDHVEVPSQNQSTEENSSDDLSAMKSVADMDMDFCVSQSTVQQMRQLPTQVISGVEAMDASSFPDSSASILSLSADVQASDVMSLSEYLDGTVPSDRSELNMM
jgi:hypothetical protein